MRYNCAWLLAISGSAHAALLHNWARADAPSWLPTETGVASVTSSSGWNPKITQAPGFVSEQDRVVELLRRQTDTTPWVNDHTCGWVAQEGSRAITCDSDFTCATNTDNIVGCVSGTFSPFFRVCLDYSAVQNGLCDNPGPNTGCCNSESPACATWIWTGKPAKSQFGCAAQPTIKSVINVPQFILDSLTRTTSSSTKSSVISTKTSGPISANPTETQTVTDGNGNTGQGSTVGDSTSTTNNNRGAIIGGAVGGLAVLILLVVLLCCCMRRRRNKKTSNVNKSDTRNKTTVNNTAYYHSSTENNDISHSNAFHENRLPAQDLPEHTTSNGIMAVFCCAGGNRKPKEMKEKKQKEAKQRSAPKQSTDSSVHHPPSYQPTTTREEHHHHHHYHYDPSLSGTHPGTASIRDDANSGSLGRSMSFGAQSYFNAARSPPQLHQAHAVPVTFAHNQLGINVPIVPNAQIVAMHDQHDTALRQGQDQHYGEKEQRGQVSVQQVQHQCQVHDRQYQTASFYGDNSSSEKVGGGGLGGALRLDIPRNMDHSPDGTSPIRLSAHIPKPSSGNVTAGQVVQTGQGQHHCSCCTAANHGK